MYDESMSVQLFIQQRIYYASVTNVIMYLPDKLKTKMHGEKGTKEIKCLNK